MKPKVWLAALTIWLVVPASADAGWVFDFEFGNFNIPHDIAVDSKGEVYVFDANGRIQVFTSDGQYLREKTGFTSPGGIAIDESDVVNVLDDCRVYRYTTDFDPLGSWDSCIGQGDLQIGRGIDARDGLVYIGTVNGLLKFEADGTFLAQLAQIGWSGVHTSSDGTIWTSNADVPLGLVRHFSPDGDVLIEWPTALPGEKTSNPTRVAIDSIDRVFVNDESGRVKVFRPDGVLDDLIEVQLRSLVSVELDGDSVLYVGTMFPDRVMKFHYEPMAVESETWGGVKSRFR